MVQAVVGSSSDFRALAYGQANPQTVQFIENRIAQQAAVFGNALSDYGRQFFHQAQQMYDRFHGSEAVRSTRAALRKLGAHFQRDEIRELTTLEQLQCPPTKMLRFIMAEPTIRHDYMNQRIEGYSGRYVDMNPGDIGHLHADYRKVTDGVFMEDDEHDFVISHHFDTGEDAKSPLLHDEKADILSTWELMRAYRQHTREDPTSIFGDKV